MKLTYDILTKDEELYNKVAESFYNRIVEDNLPKAPLPGFNLTTKCWKWIGSKGKDDYGVFSILHNGVKYIRRANILSYIFHIGPTGGHFVLHTCQEELCVRPEHLMLGNHSINGNHATLNRQNVNQFNKTWILTTDQVIYIRDLYYLQQMKIKEICRVMNKSFRCISDVVNFKTYKHVTRKGAL